MSLNCGSRSRILYPLLIAVLTAGVIRGFARRKQVQDRSLSSSLSSKAAGPGPGSGPGRQHREGSEQRGDDPHAFMEARRTLRRRQRQYETTLFCFMVAVVILSVMQIGVSELRYVFPHNIT